MEELSREELIGLGRQLMTQVAELDQLRWANAELTDRVARLERLVSRNSKNSGMPPSKDDDSGHRPPAASPSPGSGVGKRGNRKGAPGTQLFWTPNPAQTLDHFPDGVCGCGKDLPQATDLGGMPRISRSMCR